MDHLGPAFVLILIALPTPRSGAGGRLRAWIVSLRLRDLCESLSAAATHSPRRGYEMSAPNMKVSADNPTRRNNA
jgi:hypothetical protein